VTLHVQLTGSLLVSRGGWSVRAEDLPSRQARAVFAFLILNRTRSVAKTELAEVLWDDTWPDAWDVAVRSLVSQTRAALKTGSGQGVLEVNGSGGSYRLGAPGRVTVDLEEAARHLEDAQQALRQDDAASAHAPASVAAIILRRPFLPGFEGLWAEAQRGRQSRMRRKALESLGESWLALDEPGLALEAASEAATIDNTSEPAYRILMRASALSGNPAEGARWYHRLRAALREDLGMNPSKETERIFLSLLRH
jgi:DNA-binding SARP family transcriptional activator